MSRCIDELPTPLHYAEQCVVGNLLLSDGGRCDAMGEIALFLDVDMFACKRCARIFGLIKLLHGEGVPVDVVSLASRAAADTSGDEPLVGDCVNAMQSVPGGQHAMDYAELVLKNYNETQALEESL